MNTMERVVKIRGAINLRDFGGYPSSYGGRVEKGVLFRSGMMADLDAGAQEQFLSLGIDIICDLRHGLECSSDPTPFKDGKPRNCHIPIDPGDHISSNNNRLSDVFDHSARHGFMVEINRELARSHAADYRRVFDLLLESKGGFLIHCSAGKDRTGFGVALILLALGVSRQHVFEDYLFTNTVMEFHNFNLPQLRARYGDNLSLEDAMGISEVRTEYLAAALAESERIQGSVAAYLSQGLGLNESNLRQLREKFLVQ